METKPNKKIQILFNKIKPFLKQGSIILSSNFNSNLALISPSSIKHCSFINIKDNKYYVVEMSEHGFAIKDIMDFLKTRQSIFLFEYIDIDIMEKTMNYIYNYKRKKYGFFGNDSEYCFKLIFDLYNTVYEGKFKKMSEFFPVFKILNLEYANSNSILKSKKFKPIICIINNIFIKFKKYN